MNTSNKQSDQQQPAQARWPDAAEAIKFIDKLLETSDQSGDTSEWEELKMLLDHDRQAGRKLFANE